ncbi:MAG: dihydrofolate reductase [Clostridia bacterium]|nr:dihydrofolate reductase [Clostridia bacterium]NCC74867.1 dihydrofolate reductase [Clostridia bacterium]
MDAIVAVDLAWGIGYRDDLLFRIKADLKRFKEMTSGQIVILGRKTLATFPGGRPLPSRINLVVSRNRSLEINGATVCHNREEVLAAVARHPDKHVYVIGGSSIYREFLPDCHRVYVTRIHRQQQADTYFPNLDEMPAWQCVLTEPDLEENGLVFNYRVYEKVDA